MILLIEEAQRFQEFIESNNWDFFFIGGLALQVWGEPRLTRDIDLTLFTNFRNETDIIETITKVFSPKFSDAAAFALSERLLPVVSPNGITIDINLSGFSDLSESFARASYEEFYDGVQLKVCSPSDFIILKTLAGRLQDWPDIRSVLIKQRDLDWDYIEQSIRQLFQYEVELEEKFERLLEFRSEHYRP